jgi:predicted ATPase
MLLYAQRWQLHRSVAEWYERTAADDLAPYYALLAHHWAKAEDAAKTIHCLEQAGKQAQQQGAYEEAAAFFSQSLTLDAEAAVLSNDYR